jgi:hypothetical protein
VTEIFDSGLLGEHVLCTLSHAWKNLMLPDGPVTCYLYVFLIQTSFQNSWGVACDEVINSEVTSLAAWLCNNDAS